MFPNGLFKNSTITPPAPLRFPQKLWKMANECRSGAVMWSPDGKSILLRYSLFREEFMNEKNDFFKTDNVSSFVRQLNLYGFRKVYDNARKKSFKINMDFHEYCNTFFQRGRPDLLHKVTRKSGVLKDRNDLWLDTPKTKEENSCDEWEISKSTSSAIRNGLCADCSSAQGTPTGPSALTRARRLKRTLWLTPKEFASWKENVDPISSRHPLLGNPEQAVPQFGNLEQAVPQLGNPEQAVPQSGNPEQAVPQPGKPEQAVPQPGNLEQAVPQPGNSEQAVLQPRNPNQSVAVPVKKKRGRKPSGRKSKVTKAKAFFTSPSASSTEQTKYYETLKRLEKYALEAKFSDDEEDKIYLRNTSKDVMWSSTLPFQETYEFHLLKNTHLRQKARREYFLEKYPDREDMIGTECLLLI